MYTEHRRVHIHRHHEVRVFLVVNVCDSHHWRNKKHHKDHDRHKHHGHKHRHHKTVYYELFADEELKFMTDVSVGHTIIDTIVFLDQHGNPMLVAPTPDSAPVWTNLAAPAIDTMSVSADGSTDTITAVAAGVDTVTVTVIVGGTTFSATQQITVNPEPQVLTSVAIDGIVN